MRKQSKFCIKALVLMLVLALLIPMAVFADDSKLQTKIIEVKETEGQITVTYDTAQGEAPEQIVYAITKNGQFVWDGVKETEGGTGRQKIQFDIPVQSLKRDVYDVIVWGAREDEGRKVTSSTFAFKIYLGGLQENLVIPRVSQARRMFVSVPFAYITSDTSMENPICYLKNGDSVDVYTNANESAVVYVVKGDVKGYMYSRALISEAFDSRGSGDDKIVQVALSQLGNVGGEPFWRWYGFSSRVEWCACYVSWCGSECGYIESGILPKFAACTSQGMPWFKDHGLWKERNYEPRPGDIIFFDWDRSGDADHVGIVEKCEDGVIHTIEGNSADACRQKTYPLGSPVIRGYGLLQK